MKPELQSRHSWVKLGDLGILNAMTMAEAETRIASALAGMMTHYYGHGPTTARAVWADDVVIVLLEETFSPAELRLIELGQIEDIKHIRRSFQENMAGDFKKIVEDATGREVRAFVSDTDMDASLSVEVFVLGGVKTDMEAFEPDEPGSS